MSHHCNFCGLHFTSLPTFYRHRIGVGDERRCMTETEMFNSGLRVGEHFSFKDVMAIDTTPESHPNQFSRYITKPYQRTRQVSEPKESIEAAHVRWCFRRGVPPDRIVQAGIPLGTVLKIVNDEVKAMGAAS